MPSRLAERLDGARRRGFVGRTEERALFESALAAAELPFFVLYVFGPGGVGKTALLDEFAHICHQAQTPVITIDGRDVDPSHECFISALQSALGLTPPVSPLQMLASHPRRHVILIDTYEALAPLDSWLCTVFLPQLPENVLMVLASSNPPSLAFCDDTGWQAFVHVMPLRNLAPQESRAYLTNRQVPPEKYQAILDFTHGHPLALSLVADVLAQRRDPHFQPEAAPDVIQALLERLVQKVPGPAHRTVLEACAMVRVTTEALLAEMLAMSDPSAGSPVPALPWPVGQPALARASGPGDRQVQAGQAPSTGVGHSAHELFEWLRGLSFIEAGREGLFPHDMVRAVLAADLRWRNPDWYAELHRRARTYYTRHVQQTAGQAQQRTVLDFMFLHRDNPVVRPFFEWQAGGNVLTDALRATDLPGLAAMVTRHEDEDSARLAMHWFTRQPGGVLVFRDPAGQPAGFMAMIALHQASREDISADPAARAAWGYLQSYAPLRPGEGATLFRFWMARDTYQAVSPIQSLVFVNAIQHYLVTPGLAFTFFPCAEPEFWAPMFAYADLARVPEADFEVGGRRFGVYGHDWRAAPPMVWLALLAEREVALAPQTTPPPNVTEPLVVLSRPDFERAVRHVLHDFSRPDMLHTNPLLRSRMVVERAGTTAGGAERITALQSLVEAAVQSLQSSPREIKCYRALYHTYLHPAPTQEQAAELLDVPFSTFRRHLAAGIARMTENLWQREIGGLGR